ncbi:MAG TPA: S1 RNA-binding domain-containing protein [Acidimicrobiales bacterium]|nr:S1 RNA-binding domain-containing protein [Acidimicrobiales bacterium]
MSARHVVVDGSNIATEGRSLPSLAQLDEAVREFVAENPDDIVTVVVDASFGHRVDPSELPVFEEAESAGEIVSPPAGAIGRGDAFLLRIAEKIGATVLSNDSFQEFHGEHSWLFDKGRLIGGKPVPGVGWIFMERSPVRGQKSREVVKEAKRKKKVEPVEDSSGLDLAASRARGRDKKLDRAIARATQEVIQPKDVKHSKRRRSGTPPAEPVNEPLPFITFIAAHPLGSEVVGVVSEFSSHGAFVEAFGAKCYIPLSAMGDPPPRRAREALSKGEERVFVVQALDPPRRGIELALPGFARIAGSPTAETVEAEIHPVPPAKPARKRVAAAGSAAAAARPSGTADGGAHPAPAEAPAVAPKKAASKKATSKKVASKKATAKKVAAEKVGGSKEGAKKAGAQKAGAQKAGTQKAGAEKAGAEKAGGSKKAAPATAPPVTKAAPAKKAAPANKTGPAKRAGPAGKAGAPAKKAAGEAGSAAPGTAKKAATRSRNASPKKASSAGDTAEPPMESNPPQNA